MASSRNGERWAIGTPEQSARLRLQGRLTGSGSLIIQLLPALTFCVLPPPPKKPASRALDLTAPALIAACTGRSYYDGGARESRWENKERESGWCGSLFHLLV